MSNYEARRFSRYEIDTPVEVNRSDGTTETGETINISAVGLHLKGDFSMAEGEVVKLVITPADRGTPMIEGEATVISCNEDELRLDFSSMAQKDFEHLCDHLEAINITEPQKVQYEIASNLHLLHFLEK